MVCFVKRIRHLTLCGSALTGPKKLVCSGLFAGSKRIFRIPALRFSRVGLFPFRGGASALWSIVTIEGEPS